LRLGLQHTCRSDRARPGRESPLVFRLGPSAAAAHPGQPRPAGTTLAARAAATAAAATASVDEAWTALLDLLGEYYAGLDGQVRDLSSWRGRRVLRREAAPQVGAEAAATDSRLAKLAKRHRRLKELVKAWPVGLGPLPQRARWILDALRRAEPPGSGWASWVWWVSTRQQAEFLTAYAESELDWAVSESKWRRLRRWADFVNQSTSNRAMFRYIRRGPRQQVARPVTGPDGQAQVKAVSTWWWQLWRPATDEVGAYEGWLCHLDGLPAFPPPPPLNADRLRATIRDMPVAK